MKLRLATGPVSWGVDFADAPGNPPWTEVVDGIAAAGYRWAELGPLGYLPADALARRGIGVTGGFVFEPLVDHDRAVAAGRAAATRVAAAGGRFLVIIDAVGSGLPRDGAALARTVLAIAEIARDRGLRPVVHPHAGTHVARAF
jgi:inosose dehydratase